MEKEGRVAGTGAVSREPRKGDHPRGEPSESTEQGERGVRSYWERWRRQVGEVAVTSSVSSRMPLREERKVLSTAKPWSPAAAPSAGSPSRRSRALSISVGPTRHSPQCHRPEKGTGKTETWRDGEANRSREALGETCKRSGEVGRGAAKEPRPARRAFSQLPRVPLLVPASPPPLNPGKHMGRGGEGQGGVVSPLVVRAQPGLERRAGRRGERRMSTQKMGGARR